MDGRNLIRKFSFAFTTALFCLTTSLNAPQSAQAENAPAIVGAFEQRLFLKTYADESTEQRVQRIEKQVFGDVGSGSLQGRLDRLQQILTQQQAEDKLKQEAEQARQAEQAAHQRVMESRPAARPRQDDAPLEEGRVSESEAREREVDALLDDGVKQWHGKQIRTALQRFQQVLRLDPHNAQAHFSIGVIAEQQGSYSDALVQYKLAAQDDPANGEYREAVKAVQSKANHSIPPGQALGGNLRDLVDAANAAWKRNEFVSALDLYKQVDSQDPNHALIKYNIGSIYVMMKAPTEAVEYYRLAHSLEPANPRYSAAYRDLTAALQQSRQQEEQRDNSDQQDQRPAEPAPEKKPQKKNRLPAQMSSLQTGQPFNRPSPQISSTAAAQSMMLTPTPPPNQQDVMASYGLIGKSNGQGVLVIHIGIASRAAAAGMMPGDDIRAIDGVQISSAQQLNNELLKKKGARNIPILVLRRGSMAVFKL